MENISVLDFVSVPIYLVIIYFIAYFIRDRYYPRNHPWRKYFLAGLTIKIVGAIFNGLIHHYYYGGGDTFNFFYHSRIINTAMDESFFKWVNLLFHLPDQYDIEYYRYTSQLWWYSDASSYTVAAIGAFIGIFTFNAYLPTAVIFAFIAYSGSWAMFRTFSKLYPHLTKHVAIAFLFIPTTALWGSAVYKDTVCMFGLGWLTYVTFRFMIQRDFSLQNILLAVFSFILVAKIKVYILIAFLPALGLWILLNYLQRIRDTFVRQTIKIVTIVGLLALCVFVMSYYSSQLGGYSLENIADKAEETRLWITYASETTDGSTYSLGEFDASSISGMISKFPQAVNVSLFRPYIWESKKVIMLFSAAESLLFLLLTLRVLAKTGLKKSWKAIGLDPTIQFSLIFSIIFAFAVGITTYNFGSLSRYKIPCLPFYAFAMMLIYYHYRPGKEKVLPPLF